MEGVKKGDKVEVYGYFLGCEDVTEREKVSVTDRIYYYLKKIEEKKPDLVVQDISWSPSSPKQGDTVTINVKTKNQGSKNAGGFYVCYYVDGSYYDRDYVSSLSAGSTTTTSFSWTADCGSHSIKAVADCYSDVEESNEGNNARTEYINIVCKPDLVVQDIYWSPSSPKQGDTVTINVKTKNQSSENAGGFYVCYYVDGSYYDRDYVSSLSAGSTTTTSFSWTADCGSHSIKAVADCYDAVTESNEGNNARTEYINIVCKPDLVIQDISWDKSSPKQGDTVTFTVKIKNQGLGYAEASYVYYYIDGSYVDYDYVPALSAGSTSTQSFTWTANKCGNVQVKAVADATNAVAESNEGDNTKFRTVNVECEKLDLAIIDMTYSPFPCPEMGEDISIELLVKNEGQSRIKGTHSIFINLIDNASISGRMHSFTAMREGEVILDSYNGTLNLDLSPGETQTIDCKKFKISDEGKCILANTLQVKIAPVEYQDNYPANNIINKTILMNLGSQYRYACVYHAARLAFSTFFPHGCLLETYMTMLQSNPSLQEHYLNGVEAIQNGDLATAAYEYIQVFLILKTHQGFDPVLFAKNFVEGILETSECIAKTILFLANFQVWFQHLITSFPLQVFDIESPADIIVTNEVGEIVGYIVIHPSFTRTLMGNI